jgi:pimeloyl-ACP methyl ester carboxylesterase
MRRGFFYISGLSLVVLFFGSRALSGEPVDLKTDSGVIKGTLEIPNTPEPWPVVLIIAGSGPTNRDGNGPIPATKNDHLKLLAEGLASNGIGSLRFDKRGIAESAKALAKEDDIRFETYIDDVVQWGKQLQKDRRVRSLVVLGHSEGSLIGMVACQKLDAKGFISVSGAGRPASELLLSQIEPKVPSAMFEEVKSIVEQLKNGKTVKDVPPYLNSLFRPSVQPYIISWFKYDPAAEIARVKVPTLIIQGTTDIQCSVEDAKLLDKSGKNAKLLLVEGMNHIMKKVPDDQTQQIKSYGDPSLPIVPEMIERMVAFIKGLEKK